MVSYSCVALLLFGLTLASATPAVQERIGRPSWWPENAPWPTLQHPESIPWPPQWPENAPSWWPDRLPWPPTEHPEWIPWPPQWPEQPSWWPESLPWPPSEHPEWIPWPPQWPENAPTWWPESLPWPPTEHPEWIPWPPQWPEDAPSWWPESLPWPPTEHPEWIPWPPQWPEDAPSWWPESLPWPPTEHPEWVPWPPQWPEDAPSWWPESFPWPPTEHPEWIPWPPQIPDINPNRIPYIPSRDNRFHLFTRANPSKSQPIVFENANVLAGSYFQANRRTVLLVHDLKGTPTDTFNAVLVRDILEAADVNIIVTDWSAGARENTALSTFYSILSGNFIARFVDWLASSTNADLANFHFIGVGIGALNVGFISRRLDSKVGYVTALDPSKGPAFTTYLPALRPTVSQYTEVIHTDAGNNGYAPALGDVDFYPNGGNSMAGCGGDSVCSRLRSVYYFAESVRTGGFTGTECRSHREAINRSCDGEGRLNMGGLEPKTGSSGVYYFKTNPAPPFSQG